MKHLTEIELIQLAGCRQQAASDRRASEHAIHCESCRIRIEQLRLIDSALEGWRENESLAPELLTRVLDQIEEDPVSQLGLRIGSATRLAALIALSVVGGHVMAMTITRSGNPTPQFVIDAEESMQLAALSAATPAGLLDMFAAELELQESMP